MKKKQISLEVINLNAAGIDIGNRSHWVTVGQNAQDVSSVSTVRITKNCANG